MHKFFAKTLFLGKKAIYLTHCHSTNDELLQMINSGRVLEGMTIIADFQAKGRGQRGNSWESEPGKNLLFSFLLRPHYLQIQDQFFLNKIVSLGILRSLQRIGLRKVRIKWPNDIYVDDCKIAGILIELSIQGQRMEHAVVGIGLNVNQHDFDTVAATSAYIELGIELNKDSLLEDVLRDIEYWLLKLRNTGRQEIDEHYLQNLYRRDEEHSFEVFGEEVLGIIQGVNDRGQLQLQTSAGVRSFGLKEIIFIR
ncbi:MAG: biotin--[acetyl-CoA-carboxylase] ligase [Cyclobacteriaceae bacterium]|nr:biotin--[acetyl-CoA-carboxylase] ligase [Cyclobacteriaceae bacterium HetDA_MAG_MS6]